MKSLSSNCKRIFFTRTDNHDQSSIQPLNNSKSEFSIDKHPKFIVALGASAWGLDALNEMVRGFSNKLDAAYCIVLHLSRNAISDYIVLHLARG